MPLLVPWPVHDCCLLVLSLSSCLRSAYSWPLQRCSCLHPPRAALAPVLDPSQREARGGTCGFWGSLGSPLFSAWSPTGQHLPTPWCSCLFSFMAQKRPPRHSWGEGRAQPSEEAGSTGHTGAGQRAMPGRHWHGADNGNHGGHHTVSSLGNCPGCGCPCENLCP